MRPRALTQAARNAASRRQDSGGRAADRPRAPRIDREVPGERRVSRPPRAPRRMSGPVNGKVNATRSQSAARSSGSSTAARSSRPARMPRGVFASGSAAVAAAVALPLRRPFIDRQPPPRRVPKPVPAPARTAKPATGILRGIGAFVLSLPDHALLDRVVRGRAWISLLGVLLAGIVAAQVEILKLGASMGRALEQTTTLTSQNELLRDSVAALSDDQRIEHLAANMGMVLPPPGAVGYLNAAQNGDVSGALANIHAPDAAAFIALAPVNGALVTGPGTSMLPTSSGVLAQAGTPGTATPTSTPSATSTVTPTETTASAGIMTGTTTATGTTSTTGAPTTAGGASTTPSGSQTYSQSGSQTYSQGGSQTPASGAAAIQPAGATQQSSGG